MSNSIEGTYEDQARGLRQLTKEQQTDEEEFKDIDVLNLPPRSSVHNEKPSKTKWRIRYPVIRLLVVLIMLLVLFIPIYMLWNNLNIDPINQERTEASFEFMNHELFH
ncbi:hypothetical protein GLW08_17355 [Pontibacillus yanchengensis]|uniref:Uncharacterized protein n=2 Tax=Pontibacillus yanchengensis TaxID=462910 RepID=A0A6I4ZXM5_9BACI|nr:hypothetical protein [Pontibacillus yanchengensis]MYL32710.1 hypothetical protein [Pontibacillus yanchengensis]MYL55104.1 hypothetical protein [Pontibacillus yanchengensis]